MESLFLIIYITLEGGPIQSTAIEAKPKPEMPAFLDESLVENMPPGPEQERERLVLNPGKGGVEINLYEQDLSQTTMVQLYTLGLLCEATKGTFKL